MIGIDVLVNNAGAPRPGGVMQISMDDFDNSQNVNIRSTFKITQDAVPYLEKSGQGTQFLFFRD